MLLLVVKIKKYLEIYCVFWVLFFSSQCLSEVMDTKEIIDKKVKQSHKVISHVPKVISELDSNGNWLRDDLEIYISYSHMNSPKKRAALIQFANILERIHIDNKQSNDARQISLWIEEQSAKKCLYSLGFNIKNIEIMMILVLNSIKKKEAYEKVVLYRALLDRDLVFFTMDNDNCDLILFENEIIKQSYF